MRALTLCCLAAVSCGPGFAGDIHPTPGSSCHNEQELSVCAAGPTVSGIDVSKWDGAVDWARVRAAGHRFAFARVGDGQQYTDPTFATNWAGMKQQGLARGVYQFFRPAQDPELQADLLLSQLAAAGGLQSDDLPPVLDVEVTDGESNAKVRSHMQRWLDRVQQRTGRTPLIYTAAFMQATIGTGFARYPLWVANYAVTCPNLPGGWTKWSFWQSSDTGTVAGIAGPVDLDRFDGTWADLIAFARASAPDAGPFGPLPPDPALPLDAGDAADAGRAADAGGEAYDAGSAPLQGCER